MVFLRPILFVLLMLNAAKATAFADAESMSDKTPSTEKRAPRGPNSSSIATELAVSVVQRVGGDYWLIDPNIESCCLERTSVTLDFSYELNRNLGLLVDFYAQEGDGFSDPAAGFYFEFNTSNRLKWTGTAMLSAPITSDSRLINRTTTAYVSIKPTWKQKRWRASLEASATLDFYSGPPKDDEEDEEETDEDDGGAPLPTNIPPELIEGRSTSVLTAALETEYLFTSKISTFLRFKESVHAFDPKATIYWTQISAPGLKYRYEQVQWLLETRWSTAAKYLQAPNALSIVASFIAATD